MAKILVRYVTIIYFLLHVGGFSHAIVVKMKDGNRLSGTITKAEKKRFFLMHSALGSVAIPIKSVINSNEVAAIIARLPNDPRVRGTVSVKLATSIAATVSHGASDLQLVKWGLFFNRNALWIDEWTFNLSAEKNVENGERVVQKLYSNFRYGISLTKSLYGFARLAAEHDRVANIDLRLVATAGVGYWFADSARFKLMVEGGSGYRQNYYSDDLEAGNAVFQLRFFMRNNFSARHSAGIDSYFFPSADDIGSYIVSANFFYKIKVTNKLALKLNYQLEYNTAPYLGAKKYDGTFSSGLEWNL